VVGDAPAPSSSAADEAFAKMVAANPGCTVIGSPATSNNDKMEEVVLFNRDAMPMEEPMNDEVAAALAAGGGWVFSSELDSHAMIDVQGLIAANGLAAGSNNDREARNTAAEDAFAKMVAANPGCQVVGDAPAPSSSAADEAFAKMVAANPGCTVIGSPATSNDADEAFARMAAAHPSAKILGSGNAPGAAPGGSGWKFSKNLPPGRLAEFQALIAMNEGLRASDVRDDDEATRIAGDEAFAKLVASHPGAKEMSAGVFCVDRAASSGDASPDGVAAITSPGARYKNGVDRAEYERQATARINAAHKELTTDALGFETYLLSQTATHTHRMALAAFELGSKE